MSFYSAFPENPSFMSLVADYSQTPLTQEKLEWFLEKKEKKHKGSRTVSQNKAGKLFVHCVDIT